MRKGLSILGIILVLPFAVMVLGVAGSTLLNNHRLGLFQDQLYKYELPAGMQIESRRSEIGVLLGEGNHCDFEVSLVLRGDLSLEAVKAHYEDLALEPVRPGTEQGLAVVGRRSGLVEVRIWDGPGSRWLDLRCT